MLPQPALIVSQAVKRSWLIEVFKNNFNSELKTLRKRLGVDRTCSITYLIRDLVILKKVKREIGVEVMQRSKYG